MASISTCAAFPGQFRSSRRGAVKNASSRQFGHFATRAVSWFTIRTSPKYRQYIACGTVRSLPVGPPKARVTDLPASISKPIPFSINISLKLFFCAILPVDQRLAEQSAELLHSIIAALVESRASSLAHDAPVSPIPPTGCTSTPV